MNTVASWGRWIRRKLTWRAIALTMGVLALTAMAGIPGIFAPWFFFGTWPGHEFPEAHRWHDAQWGAMFGVILGPGLLLLAWKGAGRQAALAQFLVLAAASLVLINLPFNPLILLGLLAGVFTPIAAVAYLYPDRPGVRALRPIGSINWPLIVFAAVVSYVILRDSWIYLNYQWDDFGGEHAKFQHWTIGTVQGFTILWAGLIAATNRGGARRVGLLGAASLVYLGLAALRVPNHTGSWGTSGGYWSIAAGVAFAALTLVNLPAWVRGRLSRVRQATG
jgi:hypothetical protein